MCKTLIDSIEVLLCLFLHSLPYLLSLFLFLLPLPLSHVALLFLVAFDQLPAFLVPIAVTDQGLIVFLLFVLVIKSLLVFQQLMLGYYAFFLSFQLLFSIESSSEHFLFIALYLFLH